MATFTTWAALKTAVLDAIATYVEEGGTCVGEFWVNGRRMRYRGIDELERLLQLCDSMANAETAGSTATRVSYGRYRRNFR